MMNYVVGYFAVSSSSSVNVVAMREREMAEGEFQLREREREREGHIKLYDRHQMGSSYQKYAAMHINFRNQISKSDTEKGERERGEKMK